MTKLLVDTNIIIDLLSKRKNFYPAAASLFTFADQKKIKLFVSSITFTTTIYILSKQKSSSEAKEILRKLKILVKVLSLDEKIIDLSLNDSKFNDFENAVQYYTAIENNMDTIITRNLKDFKNSTLPVFTANDFLSGLNM